MFPSLQTEWMPDLLQRMMFVQRFSFSVTESVPRSVMSSGTGIVHIAQIDSSTVRWEEEGVWSLHGSVLRCTNSFQWSFHDATCTLSHSRRGIEVPLLNFSPATAGFHSTSPHYCDKDRYEGALRLDASRIVLHFTCTGPMKKYTKTITYS